MAYKLNTPIADVFSILEIRSKTVLREADANKRAYDALVAAQNGENNTQWARRLFGYLITDNVPMTLTPHFVGSENAGAILEGTPGHAVFNGAVPARKALLSGWTNPANNITTLVTSVVSPDKLYLGEFTTVASETDPNPKFWQNATASEEAIVQDVVDVMGALLSEFSNVGSNSTEFDAFVL